jgi:hypothetical protein
MAVNVRVDQSVIELATAVAVNVRVDQSALELVILDITNVRVCQSVIEFITSPGTNVRVCQSVIEFITSPGPPVPPAAVPLRITLRGVKVVRACPPSDAGEVPQLPSVPRAV